jgi:diguanylate cyclase (GGDEF)-like protein/PAS domain S-box-containing protein
MKRKDGSRIFTDNNPGLLELNGRLYVMGVFRDATLRRQAEEKLRLTAKVFESTLEGIIIADADRTILDVNGAFTRITGYDRDEVLGKNPRFLKSGYQDAAFYAAMWQSVQDTGHWSGEIWNRRRNGEIYPEWITVSAITDDAGRVTHYVGVSSDISLIKEREKQLEHIAHFDVLTQLPNRRLLSDRIHQAMLHTQRHGGSLAVVYLDLDGFKKINDQHGHDIGDRFLVETANRIRCTLREGDTLARIGGDEFVGLLENLEHADDCQPILVRILEALATPTDIDDTLFNVTASIGVTVYPQDDVDADQLIRHADQAMYRAKLLGKNRYVMFDQSEQQVEKSRLGLLENVRSAMDRQEFVLHYQPKVSMRTGEVVGLEALIRWNHPVDGLLLPGQFLPSIQDDPISVQLGDWVIATALNQVDEWRGMGLSLTVSVNVCALQLQNGQFARRLQELLALHPEIFPSDLELEILESSALEDLNLTSEVMRTCRAFGIRFALDDFGTGYSSLAYLKHLPADTIKIDRSFVRDMLGDPEDLTIVRGIIGIAKAFGLDIVAEGVESRQHGEWLLAMGCNLAQGYGIAAPMPASEIPDWVSQWQQNTEQNRW